MKNQPKTRCFVMTVLDMDIVLGRPLPLRPAVFGKVVPIAEVMPESVEKPQYYSIRAFGAILGVSRATINREIKAGHLKTQKVRKRRMIPLSEAMAYLSSSRGDDVPTSKGE